MHAPPRPVAYLFLALSMAMVGSYVALSKPLAAVFPVFLLMWLRFGIGVLLMPHWLRKPPQEPGMTRHTRWLLFLESLFGNFLFTLCMISGMQRTTAVAASIIMACIPAAVALLGWLFLRERISLRVAASIVCAVTGIALLSLSPSAPRSLDGPAETAGQPWLGNLLLVCAVLCEAAYSVIGKKLTASLGPRRITSIINLWGFALSTPLGVYAAWSFPFGAVPGAAWLLLLFYAAAACMWTVWLWMTALKSVPAAQAGVFTVFLPVSTAITGVLALHEQLSATRLLALAVALAGVLLATLPQRRSGKRPHPAQPSVE